VKKSEALFNIKLAGALNAATSLPSYNPSDMDWGLYQEPINPDYEEFSALVLFSLCGYFFFKR